MHTSHPAFLKRLAIKASIEKVFWIPVWSAKAARLTKQMTTVQPIAEETNHMTDKRAGYACTSHALCSSLGQVEHLAIKAYLTDKMHPIARMGYFFHLRKGRSTE